jgi:CBS domain-containing protein
VRARLSPLSEIPQKVVMAANRPDFLRLCSATTMATLGEIMTRDVLTVDPSDTIGEAAEKMTSQGVGAVIVSDFGRMIGIFTERDLMRAVAGRVHSSEARVREWMTPDPITMTEDASIEEAGETMVERGFRHIPVVADERAIGIVSIRDVAEWRLKHA